MDSLYKIADLALPIAGGILFIFFTAVFVTSLFEKEERAAFLSLLSGFLLSLPFLTPFLFGFVYPAWISLVLCSLFMGAILALFFPFRGRISYYAQNPVVRFDERDTMFSRRTLVPGSKRFDKYYALRPGNKPLDNKFRRLPGLLKAGTRYYDPILFAAANSMFDRIVDELHPRVDGKPTAKRVEITENSDWPASRPGRRKSVGDSMTAEQPEPDVGAMTAGQISRVLLKMARDWGAHSAGITELKDYHIYTYGGRGDRYDEKYGLEHKYAIALTVEMDFELMRTAPAAPTVLESARQYLQSGMIAVQLAEFIRSLGYPARAHIDGNYKVICPLVARDAGLGEIGRMGLLMTPRLGPRCRIAVITTDLPLLPGQSTRHLPTTTDPNEKPAQSDRKLSSPIAAIAHQARPDPTVIDFCRRCEKCAVVCPAQSIQYGPEKDVDGVKRWKIDDAGCFTYWCQAGTDCGRCMIVCPYAHPDNWFHRFIRFGIRENALFRRMAIPMDDLFYGKKPKPRDL